MAGAVISLLTRDGGREAETVADSLGRFRLAPPESGEYLVQAVQYGYETTRTPLLALSAEGSMPLELMMRPVPIGLPGLEVTVEDQAEEFLGTFGLTPARLGSRWIDRDDIEAMNLPGGAKDVIRWQNIPGVWIRESDVIGRSGPAQRELCLRTQRRGGRGCALVILNGVRVSHERALDLLRAAGELEAIAILTPAEAAMFYGTSVGNSGAILIWTRNGGR